MLALRERRFERVLYVEALDVAARVDGARDRRLFIALFRQLARSRQRR